MPQEGQVPGPGNWAGSPKMPYDGSPIDYALGKGGLNYNPFDYHPKQLRVKGPPQEGGGGGGGGSEGGNNQLPPPSGATPDGRLSPMAGNLGASPQERLLSSAAASFAGYIPPQGPEWQGSMPPLGSDGKPQKGKFVNQFGKGIQWVRE